MIFRVLAAVSLAIFVTVHLASKRAAADRPNIIFIMSDDQGWGDTGFNGHEILKTPHLDAMAAGGMRLNRFYSANPVCSPTRASCLTGRHAYRTGVWIARDKQNFRNEEVTLAEVLQPRGYATGFFGKWHFKSPAKDPDPNAQVFGEHVRNADSPWEPPLHEDNVVTPWDNGFEVSYCNFGVLPTYDPLYTPEYPDKGYIGQREVGEFYGSPYFEKQAGQDYRVIREGLRGPNPQVIVDQTIPFLRTSVAEDRPFLCYVWFNTPHRPVVAGKEHRDLYPDLEVGEQHWYGCITAMDEQIGRLRDEICKLGVADNTMLWFCSDNGPAGCGGFRCYGSTGGLRGGKGSLWEGGVRVPGILEWPAQIDAGSVCEAPISTSDYLPTILGLLGIADAELIQPIDGRDVWPLITGDETNRTDPIYFRNRSEFAVIKDRWKLHGTDKGDVTLHDLQTDRSESKDLSKDQPELLGELMSGFRVWEESWRKSLARHDYK